MEVSNIKFPASGSQADTSGQTDGWMHRHDEAKSSFLWICKHV